MEFELFFDDLTEEAQARLLEFCGLSAAEDANWDTFPIATVVWEEEPNGNRA
jgi:hypothetical protein